MSSTIIERLSKEHDRESFECGNPVLDSWLKAIASQHAKRDLAVTYVLTRVGERKILGYYSLTCHALENGTIPLEQKKGLPKSTIPVALLARFAIDQELQGQGYGRILLMGALARCIRLSEQIGLRAVEVDAIDNSARDFYTKFGFLQLLDKELHLFIPISDARITCPADTQ